MVLNILSVRGRFFVMLDPFLPFYQKYEKYENMKNIPKYQKYQKYQKYKKKYQKYENFEKFLKKPGEILSFYTSVPKIMIICYTVPEIWCVMDIIVIFYFGLSFSL